MLNKFVFMGRLTRDPEMRRTQAGKVVTQFAVACDRDAKNADGSRSADFIDCVAWNQTGEFVAQYFHKGQLIVIDSRLGSREWTDKDGRKRMQWEAIVNNVYFAGGKDERIATSPSAPRNDGEESGRRQAPRVADFAELDGDDSELPF